MSDHSISINHNLYDPYMDTMNFLNEISINYPQAISFASGRPDKKLFNIEKLFTHSMTYLKRKCKSGKSYSEILNDLGQYNKTKGIINHSISQLLKNDEHIKVKAEDIILTDGAQEGMCLIINTLFSSKKDVLLISDPSYIGFVGYAKIYGVPIYAINRKNDSIDLDFLDCEITKLKKQGLHPKVVYETPDFHNPTGFSMPLYKRKQFLELAEKHNFYIVEDNAYGYFTYDTKKLPTLKALDIYQRVIYLGSFSKTLFPSIRLGYLVVDQAIMHNHKKNKLVEEFKKTKSYTTVNTSTFLQVIVEALLHKEKFSLVRYCKNKVSVCHEKRDELNNTLNHYFKEYSFLNGLVNWELPRGGFFMTLDLPFDINDTMVMECVKKYSVIYCPMYFFCIDKSKFRNKIRLAFSNVSLDEIKQGVHQLHLFVKNEIDTVKKKYITLEM